MIAKAVGYGGFTSYRDTAYPTLKVGARQQAPQRVFSATVQPLYRTDMLANYHHKQTAYQQEYLKNTLPQHYEANLSKKPPLQSTYGHKSSTRKDLPCGHEDSQYKTGHQCNQEKAEAAVLIVDPLKTGVEHWRTTSKSDYKAPAINKNASQGSKDGGTQASHIQNKNKQAQGADKDSGASKATDDKQLQQFWHKARRQSLVSRVGQTEYKFKYGVLGHRPTPHLMDENSVRQPLINDELKQGTTQLTSHIPGYMGFLPSTQLGGKAFEQGKGLATRTTFLKNNLIENYQTKLPGYTGLRPRSVVNLPNSLREACLSSS